MATQPPAGRGVALLLLLASSGPLGLLPAEARAQEQPPLAGRVILLTGSTDGLGRETALRLAELGAHLLIHGRNEARGAEVVEAIRTTTPGSAQFYRADFASLAEVRQLASQVLANHTRLDALVNNAGIWLTAEEGRQLSMDGHELHFQVNYLSGFLLSHLLLPILHAGAPSRIVHVASAAQQPIDWSDVMLELGYTDGRAYAQSKLAQILLMLEQADELAGTGVQVTALHPATMMDTGMVLDRGATPRASVEDGVMALLHQILAAEVRSGEYYNGTTPARAHPSAYDSGERRRLMELSHQLVGTSPESPPGAPR